MNKNVENFEFYRGDTYSRNIVLENVRVPIDEMYFTVRSNDKAKVLVQKKLKKGLEIVSKEDMTYKILLTVEAIDTDDMQADFEYFYDLELISGARKRTILEGTVILATDYTRTRNEV